MTLLTALIFCVLTVSGPVPAAFRPSGGGALVHPPPSGSVSVKPSRTGGIALPGMTRSDGEAAVGGLPGLADVAIMADGAGEAPRATSWRWPLGPPVPVVVRDFSPPTSPWLPGHRGVDLATSPGDPVYAAGPGRVSYAGVLAGRDVVAITNGELRTTYLPVRPAVPVGRDVTTGARIGTVEAGRPPPHCSQACLHWGLLRGTTYLDPLALVRPVVRLLPFWQPSPAPDLLGSSGPPEQFLSSGPRPLPDRRLSRGEQSPQALDGRPSAHDDGPTAEKDQSLKDDRPLNPALRGASTATAGTLTCLILALLLALVRHRARARSRSRPRASQRCPQPPPNVIDLAHERRLRRPPAPQHHR
ncbi:M23 family metallopeptidase [Spirillospora sp. NPDC052269]